MKKLQNEVFLLFRPSFEARKSACRFQYLSPFLKNEALKSEICLRVQTSKEMKKGILVYGAEPAEADDAFRSLELGEIQVCAIFSLSMPLW